MLKAVIVLLMLALIASLGSGFYFLMTDQGDPEKRRLLNSLGVRITLAISLMVVVVYGVASGKLTSQVPWEQPRVASPETTTAAPDEKPGPPRQ